jgi:tetratricopeptide (TPR) repeat protein
MQKKTCFVIMGFGKKTDFQTGRSLDLDKTYKNIIHPAVTNAAFECIRADEIQDSNIIDKSMYAFLLMADLVIADISTYNPNAIYELGIRHGVRPYSTIILKEKDGKIPFDLDHTRIFTYRHLGEDIGTDESDRCVKLLTEMINSISKQQSIDSPLYEYISSVKPPFLSDEEYNAIIKELARKEKHIFAITESAKDCMNKSDFEEACNYWEKAIKIMPNEEFFVQQFALSKYKSKKPSHDVALTDALTIINKIHPTNDPETLGITGAIYKNKYFINEDVENLNRAIEYYGKGFKIRDDYYNGENYALCLNMKSLVETNKDEKIYSKVEAKKTRVSIIQTLEKIKVSDDFESRTDKKWIFATLANCYLALKDEKNLKINELKFIELAVDWEKETYEKSKQKLKELLNENL